MQSTDPNDSVQLRPQSRRAAILLSCLDVIFSLHNVPMWLCETEETSTRQTISRTFVESVKWFGKSTLQRKTVFLAADPAKVLSLRHIRKLWRWMVGTVMQHFVKRRHSKSQMHPLNGSIKIPFWFWNTRNPSQMASCRHSIHRKGRSIIWEV